MTRTRTAPRRDRSARRSLRRTSKGRRTGPFEVLGLTCGRCVGTLMDALMELPGTTSVRIDPGYGGVSVVELSGASPDTSLIRGAIGRAGFRSAPASAPRPA
jgi:copper chaperone CopZ